MKIVHFLNCSGHGGDAKVALLVAKQQQHSGHDVQLIIEQSDHSADFVVRATQQGVRVSEASTLRDDRNVTLLQRVIEMRKILYPYRNSVLHFHTGRPVVRMADVIAIRLLPFSTRIATVHAPSDWTSYSNPERHKQIWRLASYGLDYVLCPSEYARQVQLEAGLLPAKVRVQHNPVDIASVKSGDRTILRQQIGLTDTDLMILFLARLDSDKSPVDAINAFSVIAQKFPHAYLALAGSGEQESTCRVLIQKLNLESRIHLLGYRTDTANLLSAADIYLLPTKRENLSMSLLEALAAGLPIITTPVGGNLEVVQAEKTAILADAGNIAALSGALERLLRDQQLRQAMGTRAYESVHRFSLSTVAHQQITLYQEIISAKSSKLPPKKL